MGKTKEQKESKIERENAMRRLINTLLKIINKKSGKARNEFRYNIATLHYNHVISADENNDEYIALGLTTQPITDGVANMPLSQNPQKGKLQPSHIRNGEIVASRKDFRGKPNKSMTFAPEDIPHVKAKKRNAKKNVKRKKKERKKKK